MFLPVRCRRGSSRIPRFEIVGVAAGRDEVVELAAEVEPHVVLLDAALSNSAALEATRRIVRGERSPRVLIMAGA